MFTIYNNGLDPTILRRYWRGLLLTQSTWADPLMGPRISTEDSTIFANLIIQKYLLLL